MTTVEPQEIAKVSRPMMLLPFTDSPSLVTVTSQEKLLASLTNMDDGRACMPVGLERTTSRIMVLGFLDLPAWVPTRADTQTKQKV